MNAPKDEFMLAIIGGFPYFIPTRPSDNAGWPDRFFVRQLYQLHRDGK